MEALYISHSKMWKVLFNCSFNLTFFFYEHIWHLKMNINEFRIIKCCLCLFPWNCVRQSYPVLSLGLRLRDDLVKSPCSVDKANKLEPGEAGWRSRETDSNCKPRVLSLAGDSVLFLLLHSHFVLYHHCQRPETECWHIQCFTLILTINYFIFWLSDYFILKGWIIRKKKMHLLKMFPSESNQKWAILWGIF